MMTDIITEIIFNLLAGYYNKNIINKNIYE